MQKNQQKKYLITIVGPTASGKTSLAIQIAQQYNTCILSADSRQFYKEISIGTAKPTLEELKMVPHYFINNLSIHDHYSVGDYEEEVIDVLHELFQEKDIVILAGGSGLFINAVLFGLDQFPDVDETIKKKYIQLFEEKGIQFLQKELKEKDPEYFNDVDIQNPHRLMRALGVIEVSGTTFSSFRTQEKKTREFIPMIINLNWDREKLYERINKRVDIMMSEGLLEEVKSVLNFKHINSLQTVGYRELFEYFEGEVTLEKAIELIKRNTRRYAKRQITWFKKLENKVSFHPSQITEIYQYIDSKIKENDSL